MPEGFDDPELHLLTTESRCNLAVDEKGLVALPLHQNVGGIDILVNASRPNLGTRLEDDVYAPPAPTGHARAASA